MLNIILKCKPDARQLIELFTTYRGSLIYTQIPNRLTTRGHRHRGGHHCRHHLIARLLVGLEVLIVGAHLAHLRLGHLGLAHLGALHPHRHDDRVHLHGRHAAHRRHLTKVIHGRHLRSHVVHGRHRHLHLHLGHILHTAASSTCQQRGKKHNGKGAPKLLRRHHIVGLRGGNVRRLRRLRRRGSIREAHYRRLQEVRAVNAQRLVLVGDAVNVLNGLLEDKRLKMCVRDRERVPLSSAHHLEALAVGAVRQQPLQLRNLFINALAATALNGRMRNLLASDRVLHRID